MGLSEEEEEFYSKSSPELQKPIEPYEHPFYNEEPCKVYTLGSRLIKGAGLEQARVLTNSIEIKHLPQKLKKYLPMAETALPDGETVMKNIIMEARLYDATQKKLPKNSFVPHIGWNPVIDKMFRPLPYPEPEFSFGWNAKREYGIPNQRKKYVKSFNFFIH